ncbi:hypothetical protein BUALT_Bualt03G0174500 [Buddleja alternifolia]|uniref:Uncharacterized protein n=1 Tax=Buddleja alternifolia TaxID=168488 RepID=A0AAV6XWS8_9LAMI|nr:hypothetical protein BUALT_Bualt03G0174500 [Buddleja alternifolia]
MPLKILNTYHYHIPLPIAAAKPSSYSFISRVAVKLNHGATPLKYQRPRSSRPAISASLAPLDLTEDNIRQVLADARTEASLLLSLYKCCLAQLFDTSVNITGKAELAELDGPYVKISLKGRFWHERSLVLARLGNYLKQRIPEILEVDIEDEKQLDDSPENF